MTTTGPPTEHRLRLASGSSIGVNQTEGYPLCLIVSESARRGLAAIDLEPGEIDLVIEMLRRAKA